MKKDEFLAELRANLKKSMFPKTALMMLLPITTRQYTTVWKTVCPRKKP